MLKRRTCTDRRGRTLSGRKGGEFRRGPSVNRAIFVAWWDSRSVWAHLVHLTAVGYDPDRGDIFAVREMEARPYFVRLGESNVVQH